MKAPEMFPDAILERHLVENIAMLFKPHEGAQKDCYESNKLISIVTGANDAGKTYFGINMAAQYGLEAPWDTMGNHRFSLYPFVPHPDRLGEIDVKATAELRDKVHPVRMPANIWISEWSAKQHRKIIMGIGDDPNIEKTKMYLPDLLAGHIVETKDYGHEKGVWEYCTLDSGSIIHLTMVTSGLQAYTGDAVHFIFLDEPHSLAIYGECVARVNKIAVEESPRGGFEGAKLLYVCTPIVDVSKPESWKDIMDLRDIIRKGPTDALDIFEMPLDENISLTIEQRDKFRQGIIGSGQSAEIQEIRLTGRLILTHGIHYIDQTAIKKLRKQKRTPPERGYLVEAA